MPLCNFYQGLSRLALILVMLISASLAVANPVATANAEAQLISEVSAVQPGRPFWVALRLQMREGWHTYWRNPGDSGLATTIAWTLPAGFQVGEILWPYPERIPAGPLLNYGYHGEVYLLTQLQPLDAVGSIAPLTLQAHANWLICKEDCIPEEAMLTLTLPVSTAFPPVDQRWADAFAKTRQALPKPSPWPVSFTTTPDTLTLNVAVAGLPATRIKDLWFFPWEDGIIEHAASQTAHGGEAGISLTMVRGTLRDKPLASLQGTLVFQEALDGGPVTHAVAIEAIPTAGAGASSTPSLAKAVLLGFLGGILLNLMPCVFPVLSIKALSFVQQAHQAPREVRWHGLAFTAGVLVCFTMIAGMLIALRAGGAQIGWGFQLQSPVFVTLLAYLLFAMALSLSGVFTLGSTLMGVGGSLATRPGYSGSFATGALATLVATPCTAPFMGTALGFALTQPWLVSLAIFQALGLGMALPYLLLSFSPALRRFLPRPGPWLERFKEMLAFPLYATAAWLVWVLSLQTGSAGVAVALTGMILLAFAAWLVRATAAAGPRWYWAARLGAGAAMVLALVLVRLPAATGPTVSQAPGLTQQGVAWEPFSKERLAELQAENRPVLVNFTAAWCITCLVNERVALNSPRVAGSLAGKGVAYLKADWTSRDPVITQMLASFGRSGVPLYVLYPSQKAQSVILPQLLTETLLLQAIQEL